MSTEMPSLCLWTSDAFVDLLKREAEFHDVKMSQLVRDAIYRHINDAEPLDAPVVENVLQLPRVRRFRVHVPESILPLLPQIAEAERMTVSQWVEVLVVSHCLALYREAIEEREASIQHYREQHAKLVRHVDKLPSGWASAHQ